MWRRGCLLCGQEPWSSATRHRSARGCCYLPLTPCPFKGRDSFCIRPCSAPRCTYKPGKLAFRYQILRKCHLCVSLSIWWLSLEVTFFQGDRDFCCPWEVLMVPIGADSLLSPREKAIQNRIRSNFPHWFIQLFGGSFCFWLTYLRLLRLYFAIHLSTLLLSCFELYIFSVLPFFKLSGCSKIVELLVAFSYYLILPVVRYYTLLQLWHLLCSPH